MFFLEQSLNIFLPVVSLNSRVSPLHLPRRRERGETLGTSLLGAPKGDLHGTTLSHAASLQQAFDTNSFV